jgi:hypothetical protein
MNRGQIQFHGLEGGAECICFAPRDLSYTNDRTTGDCHPFGERLGPARYQMKLDFDGNTDEYNKAWRAAKGSGMEVENLFFVDLHGTSIYRVERGTVVEDGLHFMVIETPHRALTIY